MLRTTTLLIVTMLAGGPVGSVGCELWCASPAAGDHHRSVGCHDGSEGVPSGRQVASTDSCPDGAAIPPFVTEPRHKESAGVAAPLPLDDVSSIGKGTDERAAGWYVFDVQPPRPSAFGLVLRI